MKEKRRERRLRVYKNRQIGSILSLFFMQENIQMKKRFYLGFAIFIVLLGIAGVLLLIQRERAELKQLEKRGAEADKLLKDSQKLQGTPRQTAEPTTPTQPDKTDKNGGHTHDDGTFHEGAPENPIETEPSQASRDFTPAQVKIPEGITDPDVKAAWERVEYIANNIWEWGGVPSAENEELIKQLMPPPDGFSGPTGHSDAEETINLLGWLDRNDPRSIVVMATYLCEGRVGGRGPKNALVKMGVPAVPYLVPYMLDMELKPVLRSRALEVLCQIAEKHREDLGGIVDHIIIPRLEAILSEEKPDYFEGKDAREALARLKK